MGINPERITMLTFGLGSGIAGIAGVAIGLYAKVTSEMGADYIVQSFMILFIIIFIQFRPKGIVAHKGRAAGN